MTKIGSFLLINSLFLFSAISIEKQEELTRYIIIEAPCKPNFPALSEYTEKVIITKVFLREFENAFEMVNAEQDLIEKFEVALEKSFPNSRNQIKDILVYMLNDQKEAKELLNRKKKLLKTLGTGIIELKIK